MTVKHHTSMMFLEHLSVSMSYFTETVTLPVVETNRY